MSVTGDDVSGPSAAGEGDRLVRSLQPRWVWAIALGSAVGWGVFILPTDWIATAGPVGAISGFVIGGLLMMLIAVSYGLLIRTFPVSGGEFAYALVGYGRRHAFLCGWFLVLGYTCIVALNASALAVLARTVAPDIAMQGRMYEVAGYDVYFVEVLLASIGLLAFLYTNVRGTTLSGRIQFAFCIVMLIAVACVLVGVLLHPDTSLANTTPAFPDGTAPLAAIAAIVAIAPWAYVGFDNVPQAAEEFDFAPAKAFRLIILALLAATLIYVAMILAVSTASPWETLVERESSWLNADAMSDLFGSVGVLVLSIGLVMGISTGLNGFYVAASRLLLAMGRAQMVPSALGRVHPKYKTPHVAIVFVGAVCLIAPWFGREALLWVVDMSAIGVTIAYLYTCLVAYKLFRWSGAEEGEELDDVRSTRKKLLSMAGAVIAGAFLALLLVPGSPAALGQESLIALAVWVALGLVFFLMRKRHNDGISDNELDLLVIGQKRPADLVRPDRGNSTKPSGELH